MKLSYNTSVKLLYSMTLSIVKISINGGKYETSYYSIVYNKLVGITKYALYV